MANPWDSAPIVDGSDSAVQPWDLAPIVKQPSEATAVDRVRSVATGLNRGAFTRMAGLPVDTIINIGDLLKAAYGTTVQAAGRKDLAPDIATDRSNMVLSGDWIEKQVRKAGLGATITPTGPNDATARVLHSGGMGAGGAIAGGRLANMPMSNMAQARNIAIGGAGGTAAGIAVENDAPPAIVALASMGPQLGVQLGSSAIKTMARGGEDGRQVMAQRIQDFKNAGVENPSVGLASGRPTIQGLENLMSNTPGGINAFLRSREALMNGMQAKTAEVRDQASPRYGADVAGRAIQNDLNSLLKPRITDAYDGLNNKLLSMLSASERFPITNSLAALNEATAINPMAPATTASFAQPRITELRSNMLADTMAQQSNQYYPTQVNTGMPASAIRAIRTSIGKEAASNAIMGTPEQANFKQIYGGLSQDIRNAAQTTDMRAGPQPNNLGPAERTFNRGNQLFSAGMDRIDKVQPFANKVAPEQAFNALTQSGKENVSTLRAVKKSIGNDARASTAATWIDRLGRASPGNQNELSDKFSPDRLLTNWNTMAPKARAELLSGYKGSERVAASMDDIAKAASMLKDSSKVWANPSGSGANMAARATIGATAFGAFFSPLTAAGVGAGIGGVNLASRLMTNQKFVTWLADSTRIPSSNEAAQLARLSEMASASDDEKFKRDVEKYVQAVEAVR